MNTITFEQTTAEQFNNWLDFLTTATLIPSQIISDAVKATERDGVYINLKDERTLFVPYIQSTYEFANFPDKVNTYENFQLLGLDQEYLLTIDRFINIEK